MCKVACADQNSDDPSFCRHSTRYRSSAFCLGSTSYIHSLSRLQETMVQKQVVDSHVAHIYRLMGIGLRGGCNCLNRSRRVPFLPILLGFCHPGFQDILHVFV